MARATQPVSINGIDVDALIESSESYTAQAPAYPVEDGASIEDTLVLEPMELQMTVFVTEYPVTWLGRHGGGGNRVRSVTDALVEAFKKKSFITVATYEKTYENMVITSLELPKTQDMTAAMEIPITLSQVTVTSTATGTVTVSDSYSKSGATGKSTGAAKTSGGSGNGDDSGSDGRTGIVSLSGVALRNTAGKCLNSYKVYTGVNELQ